MRFGDADYNKHTAKFQTIEDAQYYSNEMGEDLVLNLEDSIDYLKDWDVHNDDLLSEELGKALDIIKEVKRKMRIK